MVSAAVEVGRLRNENDLGADAARVRYIHDIFDAKPLGFARTSNDAGVLGPREWNHPDRTTPQMRMRLLFDRGEKAVEVEIQTFDFGWLTQCPEPRGRSTD